MEYALVFVLHTLAAALQTGGHALHWVGSAAHDLAWASHHPGSAAHDCAPRDVPTEQAAPVVTPTS